MTHPLTSRTYAEPLSLDLLKKHVPAVRDGVEAATKIAEARDAGIELDREERNQLIRVRREGSKAQEVLILSALPLIKNISTREYQRRRAWGSRISYEDLLQEAVAGFIRGLLSYNEKAGQSSPTNYLGQWVVTSIRRRIEALEHDFAVPYEVIERARRIKAVTSRLLNEKGGEGVTDEEILLALNDPDYNASKKWSNIANRVGTVNPKMEEGGKEGEEKKPRSRKAVFTQAHLDEARALGAYSYSIDSTSAATGSGDAGESDDLYERAASPLTTTSPATAEDLEAADIAAARNRFFHEVFVQMRMGSRQKDIILRFFGLPPYTEAQTQKFIIQETTWPDRYVKGVIAGFQMYMPQKGGVFHQLLSALEPDMVEALELEWLISILGDYPKGAQPEVPEILTQSTFKTRAKKAVE